MTGIAVMRSLLPIFLLATPAAALDPRDVVVVCNSSAPGSRELADHYLAARKVPDQNLVALDLPAGEDISRADYETKLAAPLRAALGPRQSHIKVLLTVYGVPLRVGPPRLTDADKAEAAKLKAELDALPKPPKTADDVKRFTELTGRLALLDDDRSTASVDSELMLLWWPTYPTARWLTNPLHWQAPERLRFAAPRTLMTARLDGPTPAAAKRLIDDAIKVEATGLKGNVVIDARGIAFDPAKHNSTGYEGYDESFRETATLLKAGGLAVTLDDAEPVLPPGAATGVALYAGWYSHGKFIDSCEFVPGAVAWHLASSEAVTLRDPKSSLWCPNLLRKGVAATLGPVAEPYTIGFPKPAEFFGLLGTGEYALVECYAKTVYFTSWMGVLVGDPLYKPFAKNPAVKEADLFPSPKGAKGVFPTAPGR
jgi:uncharacterized protein (TIGR03790 family)